MQYGQYIIDYCSIEQKIKDANMEKEPYLI